MNKKGINLPIALPRGVKDFLPTVAGRINRIGDELSRVFELWGYRGVMTPTIEYLDVLALAEPELLERMFKFEDRDSGKVIALRPDITSQIARLAATHLKDHAKPLRLHYSGSVLHYGERDKGSSREIYQSGLELIGLDQPEADGEIIAVAVEAMKATGLTDFKIDVGQVEFFRGVMEGLSLAEDVRRDVEIAVARKDRSGIEELLPSLNLGSRDEEALLALPTLFGKREVLERAAVMTVSPRAQKALENLSEVLHTIDSYGLGDFITVDLGEIRGLNYYTGVIFEGFVTGLGEEICGGGRYDGLLGRYGNDQPATGFAINVETLLKALEKQGETRGAGSPDFLLLNLGKEKHEALKVARHLRSKGLKVAREIAKRDIGGSLAFASSEVIDRLIIMGGNDLEKGHMLVKDIRNDKEEKVSIDDLISGAVDLARRG
ncbi:MAG: ATP phosphoribosyltransferase regulatory subunit [Deltaproteobacteria bacterium]|nr:ATP phosphoribosyltransferase regulatory subunit [Deltaproteobacteria bacterium]